MSRPSNSTLPLRSRLTYPIERQQFADHPEMWAFMQSNSGAQMKAAGKSGARFLCCCAPPYDHDDTFF